MIFSQLPHLGFRLIFTVLHLHPHSDIPLRVYRFYIQYFLKRMEDRIEDEVAETAVDSVIEKVKEAKSWFFDEVIEIKITIESCTCLSGGHCHLSA